MASRLNLPRLGAAVLGASAALLLSVALPANAAPGQTPAPVVGHMDGAADEVGTSVTMDYTDNGKQVENKVPTVLFGLLLKDGTLLHTYCGQLTVGLQRGIPLVRTDWGNYPDPSSPFETNDRQINWVLHHSYPQVTDLGALSKAAGLPDTISKADAIGATQAAIWSFSDNGTLAKADADITGLYRYLTGGANTGLDEPTNASDLPAKPTLSVTPGSAAPGQAGGKIGPFTVHTNVPADDGLEMSATLPAGVTLTDTSGNTIDPKKIADGTQFFVNVPAGTPSGQGSITLSTPDSVGELFVGTSNGQDDGQPQHFGAHPNCSPPLRDQAQMVAETSVTATAKFQWVAQSQGTGTTTTTPTSATTTTPTGSTTATTTSPAAVAAPTTTNTSGGSNLPFTGVSLVVPLGLAILLIGGGVTFLLLQRRRRA